MSEHTPDAGHAVDLDRAKLDAVFFTVENRDYVPSAAWMNIASAFLSLLAERDALRKAHRDMMDVANGYRGMKEQAEARLAEARKALVESVIPLEAMLLWRSHHRVDAANAISLAIWRGIEHAVTVVRAEFGATATGEP